MSAEEKTAELHPTTLIASFKHNLGAISYSRAGWDYQLGPTQRAEDNRVEKESLARVRKIWAENPSLHDDLRAAFKEAAPLATMTEIERVQP